MKKYISTYIISLFLLIMISSIYPLKGNAMNYNTNTKNKNSYTVLVDLTELRLFLINSKDSKIIKSYPIAKGKTSTPSPIGTWTVVNKATEWGSGFGTRWIGLNVPWGKYGIHGTNKPNSIGDAASHGCIRMLNKDVEDLYKKVNHGTIVIIYGGPYGLSSNNFRMLVPGYRGSDVYEVQMRMKQKGYYNGTIDGIYGEGMKAKILKFRKDNKLRASHNVDKEFLKALEILPFE
ncbi:L,D-transpeptidase family protein [Clostridium sp. DJ247]|uniref:L,D-transpeptidase family protein n=1 Tax=Clostridium sp. DJ247 TaxID=2726188 RepID=UPI0016244621|nr:L,D-transpeptidase family protein [Clostridium sp. DJ247]MBC2581064.1 L,D-transpeptidase family protein [Clostridium sp. DJ247]